MSNTNNKTSIFISSHLPSFVREDNGMFVDFLEAYYEYMEQSNNSIADGKVIDRSKNFLRELDIDTSELDAFTQKLYSEFMTYFPKDIVADKKLILKNIKDFYRSRGSAKSFKFLFRALFGKEIEIYIPRNDILIASSGKWLVEKSLRVSSFSINGVQSDSLIDLQRFNNSRITGNTSQTTASVERVLLTFELGVQKMELFLSNLDGDFTDGETITSTNVYGDELSAVVYAGVVVIITVSNTGSGYNVGNPLTFTSNSGNGAVAYVSECHS